MEYRSLDIAEKKDTKIEFKNFSDALVPILSAIALILIAIFVFIPMLNHTLLMMEQTKEMEKRYEKLQSVYTGIYSINEEDMNANYVNAITIIPDSMRVSDFAKFVNNLAISDGLSLDQIKAEDSKFNNNTNLSQISKIKGLRSIDAPLAYTGSYNDIVNFLEDLFVKIPYVISPNSVTITLVEPDSNIWKVELKIKAFYVEDSNAGTPSLYANFTPYSYYSKVLLEFKDRAANK
jgi:hypothetical protein